MISARKELLQLHQQIYRKNKKMINASVLHEEKNFKAYERHYLNAVKDFKKVATIEEVFSAIEKSDMIFVGDYHTLKQSQRSLLRILRELVQSKIKVQLAMEFIQARHQATLEDYLLGKIKEGIFLKKIGFREHWFFDLWENFQPIFDFCRMNQIPLRGIEGDIGKRLSLRERDAWMAQEIFSHQIKDHKTVVFVGDLHIAPGHLPTEVERVFEKNHQAIKSLILFQNSESIYWQLAHKGIEDQVNVVRVSKNGYCRMHTPPIISQQSYLNWLEHEEGTLDFADAKQTFLNYLDQMATFLEIPPPAEKENVEVFTCGDMSFLKRLKESEAFSQTEIREIKRQILRTESYYIPKLKLVYLANVSVNHISEEAAHTLKNLCTGEEFARPMQDAFYAAILHEALGFFGSKIINPKRKCLRPQDAEKLMVYLKKSPSFNKCSLEYRVAGLFVDHETRLGKGDLFHPRTTAVLSVDAFLGLTHAIGYSLGERLYHALLEGLITKEKIRGLFFDPFEEEGEPGRMVLELYSSLKGLRLPRRL